MGQKQPFRRRYPAKDSGRGNLRKHLLTIPTYLRSQGERGGSRIRGVSLGIPVFGPVGCDRGHHGCQGEAGGRRGRGRAGRRRRAGSGRIETRTAVIPQTAVAQTTLTQDDDHRGGRPAGGRRWRGCGLLLLFQRSQPRKAGASGGQARDLRRSARRAGQSVECRERTQYLKVKIVLELPNPEVVTQIQPLMPRVMDTFQTYLRELRPTDLDGSAGLYRLKEELTRRVNAAVEPNRVTAVLFKEIVIQ